MTSYNKKSVEDIDVAGKKTLVRCDFNVPLKDGAITSDKRIVAALPTINYLLSKGAAVILCSHLGRPKNGPEPQFSLAPVAKRLGELVGKPVAMAADVVGPDARAKAAALGSGELLMLENVRFEAGETKNSEQLSKDFASLAEVYVNDAFGSAHRAHASTAGVAAYLPAVSGYLIDKEISVMGKALSDPKQPFVSILGGAKVSDKIGVINNLLEKVEVLIVGGGMAYTFAKASGYAIGNSLCEDDKLDMARQMIEKAEARGVKMLLPVDTVCGDKFAPDCALQTIDVQEGIPEGWMGMDIGPKTVELFCNAIKGAGTVIWNGPMGVFEFERFANGTLKVAEAVAESGAISIIGGGDSAAAVVKLGYGDQMTHISTGGGASLEFLEGLELPGIAALNDR